MRTGRAQPTDSGFTGNRRFRVKTRIGEGGMGVVYLARDDERGLDVALKMLGPRMAVGEIHRLKREFRALADVTHPNLIALHELVADGDEWFFTMEYVEGVDFLEAVSVPDADPSTLSRELSTFWRGAPTSRQRPGALAPPVEEPPSHARAIGSVPSTRDEPPPSASPTVESQPDADLLDASRRAGDDAQPPVAEPTSAAPPERGTDARSPSRRADPRPPSPADVEKLRPALRQLADGILALHAANRLHLDLKPSNVMVRKDGRVVVLDFGLARELAADAADLSIDEGFIAGTPAYMAPEQAAGERLTAAADWYAVGTMLYVALTGRFPYSGSVPAVLLAKGTRDPPPPSAWVAGVPEDLDQLVVRLLVRDPHQRATGLDVLAWCAGQDRPSSDALAASFPPSFIRGPFVGRNDSLSALERAFDDVRAGRPVVTWVGGRSGFGKSALVTHFLEKVRQRASATVLTGRCYERESVPFKAFDSIVDALVRHLRSLPRSEAAGLLPRGSHELARVFPALERLEALGDVPRRSHHIPNQQELRARAFRALKELLSALADKGPLVVFVDDLQWSDADSALLLAETLSPPDAPCLFWIGAYRSDERATNHLLRDVLDAPRRAELDVRDIEVGPLPPAEAEELARRLLVEASGEDAERLSAIARESQGSPLFVGELVRHGPSFREDASHGATTLGGTTLDGLLLSRFHQLDAPHRAVLELIALSAHPIEQGVVLRAASRTDDDLGGALTALRAAHLVRTRGGRPTDLVECFHDRIRETVAAQVTGDRRPELFGRLADELEQTGRADAEILAHHCRAAGFSDRASRHAQSAAEAAARSLAFDKAARLYADALDLGRHEPSAARALEQHLGDALANAGRGREAALAYLRASRRAEAGESLDLRRLAAEQYLVSGHVDEGRKVLDEVLAEHDLPHGLTTRRALVSLLWHRGRNAIRGLRWTERQEPDVPPEKLRRIDICYTASLGLSVVDTICGAAYQAQHLAHALEAGEPNRIALGLAFESGHLSTAGASAEKRARELALTAESLCARLDNPHATGFTELMRGVGCWSVGRWREGAERCDKAQAILRERCTGVVWQIDTAQGFSMICLTALGELDEVGRRTALWLREADERGDRYHSTTIRVVWGSHVLVGLADDDPDWAEREIDVAMASWSSRGYHAQHYYAVLARLLVDLYRGDDASARRRLEETWKPLDRSLLLRIEALRVTAVAARAATTLAVAKRSPVSERASLVRAAEKDAKALRSLALPWIVPQADLLDAQIADLRSRPDLCVARLRDARSGFERAEMALHRAVVERALGSRIGGSEGATLMAAGDAALAERHVVAPDRFCRVHAPTFFEI